MGGRLLGSPSKSPVALGSWISELVALDFEDRLRLRHLPGVDDLATVIEHLLLILEIEVDTDNDPDVLLDGLGMGLESYMTGEGSGSLKGIVLVEGVDAIARVPTDINKVRHDSRGGLGGFGVIELDRKIVGVRVEKDVVDRMIGVLKDFDDLGKMGGEEIVLEISGLLSVVEVTHGPFRIFGVNGGGGLSVVGEVEVCH
jgi:hypothetical protein